ncbi:MAG: metallophosphoesterase [Bacteroidales bacterium]|nr:metallophosphoesterase [Bacteroidales bacterium]
MKKIIHLSDIHAGHGDCTDRFNIIAGNLISRMQPANDFVILITGDIVENANRAVNAAEALAVIRRLETAGYRVLVIPGNHDYGTGSVANKRHVPLFKKKFYGDVTVTYPKVDIVDGIAFIGLDSTAEEIHWFDRILAEGELGKKQRDRLKIILDDPSVAACKKVIYLHHHPFDFEPGRQLKDRKSLKPIIGNKADAILFGHYHHSYNFEANLHGTWGINRCYNAGSATHKGGNKGFHRVIDLSNDDPSSDYDGCFLDIAGVTLDGPLHA